jgi:hypothetical protein
MKNDFTANGYRRWLSGRETRRRELVRAESMGDNKYQGLFGGIRLWLKVELAVLRGTKDHQEKASPKILW